MLKVKRLRTADCVVGGFRYETGRKLVGSLLLGLYEKDGLLHHGGFTSALADTEKPALTERLEKLVAPPGFTGDAPGGPSRWSTARSAEWQPLRTKLVVEVRYDHVTGNRFRHGTGLVRWRPDKAPAQCTLEQLPAACHDRGCTGHQVLRQEAIGDEQGVHLRGDADQQSDLPVRAIPPYPNLVTPKGWPGSRRPYPPTQQHNDARAAGDAAATASTARDMRYWSANDRAAHRTHTGSAGAVRLARNHQAPGWIDPSLPHCWN
jgi:hypothetical protein